MGSRFVATGLLAAVIPGVPGSRLSGTSGLRHALAPRVLAMLALSLTLFAAPGAVMGYLMPLLEHVTGVSGPLASTILVAYGVANVAGSFLGGRLADANAARALVLVTLGLVTSSAVLYLARAQPLLAVAAILAWAVFASSAPASVQHRSMSLAGPAGGLVASLPASAASAGIALGSTASGVAYTAAGPSAVIITGMVIALGALALAVATRRLRPPADSTPPPSSQKPSTTSGAELLTRGQRVSIVRLARVDVSRPLRAQSNPTNASTTSRMRCGCSQSAAAHHALKATDAR